MYSRRKKFSPFKAGETKDIDYKDPILSKYVMEGTGRILPRRITGTTAKFQRQVARAVKLAQHLFILPSSDKDVTRSDT